MIEFYYFIEYQLFFESLKKPQLAAGKENYTNDFVFLRFP